MPEKSFSSNREKRAVKRPAEDHEAMNKITLKRHRSFDIRQDKNEVRIRVLFFYCINF